MEAVIHTTFVLDDDDVFRERLVRALTARGGAVFGFANVDAAIEGVDDHVPDRAVVDLRMPGKSGLDAVMALKARNPDIEIVLLTGYGSIATAVEAMRLGAVNYLTKPAGVEEILVAFAQKPGVASEPHATDRAPSLERVEWEHINRVLQDCGGNISKAARVLGMHRRSLQRKLARYPSLK